MLARSRGCADGTSLGLRHRSPGGPQRCPRSGRRAPGWRSPESLLAFAVAHLSPLARLRCSLHQVPHPSTQIDGGCPSQRTLHLLKHKMVLRRPQVLLTDVDVRHAPLTIRRLNLQVQQPPSTVRDPHPPRTSAWLESNRLQSDRRVLSEWGGWRSHCAPHCPRCGADRQEWVTPGRVPSEGNVGDLAALSLSPRSWRGGQSRRRSGCPRHRTRGPRDPGGLCRCRGSPGRLPRAPLPGPPLLRCRRPRCRGWMRAGVPSPTRWDSTATPPAVPRARYIASPVGSTPCTPAQKARPAAQSASGWSMRISPMRERCIYRRLGSGGRPRVDPMRSCSLTERLRRAMGD